MDGRRRQLVARVVAPLAFLAAMTVAVLVARSALDTAATTEPAGSVPAATAPATTAEATATEPAETETETETEPQARFHVVESGDTLQLIADQYGTTVEVLLELNPGIDPVALSIGQRVRVG